MDQFKSSTESSERRSAGQYKLIPKKLPLFSKIVSVIKKQIEKEHPEYTTINQNQYESICKRFLGEWLVSNYKRVPRDKSDDALGYPQI